MAWKRTIYEYIFLVLWHRIFSMKYQIDRCFAKIWNLKEWTFYKVLFHFETDVEEKKPSWLHGTTNASMVNINLCHSNNTLFEVTEHVHHLNCNVSLKIAESCQWRHILMSKSQRNSYSSCLWMQFLSAKLFAKRSFFVNTLSNITILKWVILKI